MPAQRGTIQLCEVVEHSVDVTTDFCRRVDRAIADGMITVEERLELVARAIEVHAANEPLPGMAAEVDGVLRVIGAAAGAGRVTAYVYRIVKEELPSEAVRIAA